LSSSGLPAGRQASPGDPDVVSLKKGPVQFQKNGFPIKDFGNDRIKKQTLYKILGIYNSVFSIESANEL